MRLCLVGLRCLTSLGYGSAGARLCKTVAKSAREAHRELSLAVCKGWLQEARSKVTALKPETLNPKP